MTSNFEVLKMPDSIWDPHMDKDTTPLSVVATNRIKRDLMTLFTDPPPGIFVVPDESDLRVLHILIVGPSDTPYEGGLFYFFLRCPSNYPMQPPKVKLMTTDGGKLRFHPNFYNSGKLCVSILGTWPGPSWSPIANISSLLMTIQSLMNANPLTNEPGLSQIKLTQCTDCVLYNEYITHETLRVAVCGMVENECSLNMPGQFKDIIEQTFLNYYDHYVDICTRLVDKSGTKIKVPHYGNEHTYEYGKIRERLEKLYQKLTSKS